MTKQIDFSEIEGIRVGHAQDLDAAAGVMQYLEERSIGFDVQVTRVPIVCGAVLFDLTIGDWRVRPDKDMFGNHLFPTALKKV